jgi:hypothetical protein
MKNAEAIAIFVIVTVVATLVLYNALIQHKTAVFYEQHNKLCASITDELNVKRNETSKCQDYYCYYTPAEIPKELANKTTVLCICDCMQTDGATLRFEVLAPNSA